MADLQDLGQMSWFSTLDAAESSTSQGYDDWYLPSLEELQLMYSTIGQGGGNIGGFESNWYWSSSEGSAYGLAWLVNFNSGDTFGHGEGNAFRGRVIRAF